MKTLYVSALAAASIVLSSCAHENSKESAKSLPAESSPAEASIDTDKPCISGVYPHLAMWNSEGECGTGAVVPWA